MKFLKKTLLAISVAVLLQFTASIANAASPLNVEVNGNVVDFPDARPFIDPKNNRTMIPVRFVSDKLGADVSWDSSLKVVGIKKSGKFIKIKIGDSFALIDDEKIQIDAPAVIISDRTFVPLRFISEVLGAKVEWNSENRTVSISAELIDANLKQSLESVFSKYITSYKTGKIDNIKGYSSTNHYITLKNALLSAGITELPDGSHLYEYADISDLKLHKVFISGPTIGLVYEKPLTSTSNGRSVLFAFLKFVEEGSIWRFDRVYSIEKSGVDATFTEKDIPQSMLIDGRVITDIPVIQSVEVPNSYYSISSVDGYTVTLSINNAAPVVVTKGTRSGLIIGGLKKGDNTLEVEIIPTDDNKGFFFPEIEIYYLDPDNSKKVVYTNKDSEETGKINQTFNVGL